MKEVLLWILDIAAIVIFVATLITGRYELLPFGFVFLIGGIFLSRRYRS